MDSYYNDKNRKADEAEAARQAKESAAAKKQAQTDLDASIKLLADATAQLEYNQSLLQRAAADKIEGINAKIEEFTGLIVTYQRTVDDAEGFLSQAAAVEAAAADVKREMEAIDQMQRELDALYELAYETQSAVDAAVQAEYELYDQPSALSEAQIVTERAETANQDAWAAVEAKSTAFNTLWDAKMKREEANAIEAHKQDLRDWANEYTRTIRDLQFEAEEMTGIISDNAASSDDKDWARERLAGIPDDIEWYEEQIQAYNDELTSIDDDIVRIAEEQELAREYAIEAEQQERQWRIEDALEWYEWAERDYFDALNEIEVYKDLLSQIDQEADRRIYKEYEDLMREAQMNISELESQYEEV